MNDKKEKTPEEQEEASEAYQTRKLFIEPGRVTLARCEGRTWACDAFVLLDVTSFLFGNLPDGVYRIVGSQGYRETKGNVLDAEAALDAFVSDGWSEVHETRWCVKDDEAKLYVLSDTGKYPRAVNEDLWDSFHIQYPDATWQVDIRRNGTPRFRVIDDGKVIAYISGVRIEGDIEDAALAICAAMS